MSACPRRLWDAPHGVLASVRRQRYRSDVTRWPHAALGVAASVPLLAGCTGLSEDTVGSTAQAWAAAIQDRDGSAACSLLAPATRSELEQSEHRSCPQAVLHVRLPDPERLDSAQQWGNSGFVVFDADTLFLGRFEDGWKVTAAGCRPQPERPYDCQLQGG